MPRTNVIKVPTYSMLDVSLPCLTAIWVLVFLGCSVLGIVFQGYFYCICALHVVFNNDILQRVLRAVTKNGEHVCGDYCMLNSFDDKNVFSL